MSNPQPANPLRHLPDAAPIMRTRALRNLRVSNPWVLAQGSNMVEQAVKDGRLTRKQADSAYYLCIPQADGSLFCGAVITDTPGLILGTFVPKGAWRQE